MTFDRRLANITGPVPVVRGLHYPFLSKSDKKALHEMTVNSEIVKISLIVFLLSFDT